MAEQRELQTCINVQMVGINRVNTQLQAVSSPGTSGHYTPGSDEHPENWSLDVMIASTNPAAISTDMGERLKIMQNIQNRLKGILAKKAQEYKDIQQESEHLVRRSPRGLGQTSEQDLSQLPPAEQRRLHSSVRY